MKTRKMLSSLPAMLTGWRRLGNATEQSLGRELDRDEEKLIRDYKPKVKRVEE